MVSGSTKTLLARVSGEQHDRADAHDGVGAAGDETEHDPDRRQAEGESDDQGHGGEHAEGTAGGTNAYGQPKPTTTGAEQVAGGFADQDTGEGRGLPSWAASGRLGSTDVVVAAAVGSGRRWILSTDLGGGTGPAGRHHHDRVAAAMGDRPGHAAKEAVFEHFMAGGRPGG
jgi:hypothetical protein